MAFLLDALGTLGSYKAQKAQAKAQKKIQEYSNTMVMLSNAINQNVITTNTTRNIQQSARKAVALDREELTAVGAATVSAAAAGVKGNSVDRTITNIKRGAGLVEHQRELDLEGMFLQESNQRLSSSMSAAQNQDYSYIPEPNLANMLFNTALESASDATDLATFFI